MQFFVRHTTKFQYTEPIAESVTEVRMHPRTTSTQTCATFRLDVRPQARVLSYQDHLDNVIHHFTQPGVHQQLVVIAESEVHVNPRPPLPDALPMEAWAQIDTLSTTGEAWDMLEPSDFTGPSDGLATLAHELAVTRRNDPLTLMLELSRLLHRTIAYDAGSTSVDSPIDEAIMHRRGVCQDYAHIMLALVRNYLHIPCRYVSGYLYHVRDDRSVDGATHAWVDVLLPQLGWIGLDPTNNILVGERHIEVAIGRDYHDVPPTRGVYKGNAGSELCVAVRVRAHDDPEHADDDSETYEGEPAPYQSTAQQLQARYAEALLAMQQQQQ